MFIYTQDPVKPKITWAARCAIRTALEVTSGPFRPLPSTAYNPRCGKLRAQDATALTTPAPAATPRRLHTGVLLLFLVIYPAAAWFPALMDDADSTHAEAAREMFVRGDYVTLRVNGVAYLEKAPLMYWLVAASYRDRKSVV